MQLIGNCFSSSAASVKWPVLSSTTGGHCRKLGAAAAKISVSLQSLHLQANNTDLIVAARAHFAVTTQLLFLTKVGRTFCGDKVGIAVTSLFLDFNAAP